MAPSPAVVDIQVSLLYSVRSIQEPVTMSVRSPLYERAEAALDDGWGAPEREHEVGTLIEGTVVTKEIGLRASFEGVEQPYVRCVVARLDDPERKAEARVIGVEDIPQAVGDVVRLESFRTVTDRAAGVVRFDCHLLP